MGRAIFISYRRDDAEGEAGHLYEDLARIFGEDSVFMDVAGIHPGMDFRKAIDKNVSTCGVLLAIIGPSWASITSKPGQRRLDDPNDFVRLEIASALARDIPVIPVLVRDAKMPHIDQLPNTISDLAFRNSVEITHARWNSDVRILTDALRQYADPSNICTSTSVHASVPIQASGPIKAAGPVKVAATAGSAPPAESRKSKSPAPRSPITWIVAIAACLVLAAAVAGSHHFGWSGANPQAAPTAAAASNSVPARADLIQAMLGTWSTKAGAPSEWIDRVAITRSGDDLMIQPHSVCRNESTVCEWSAVKASIGAKSATASWNQATTVMTLTPVDGRLQVTIRHSPGQQSQTGTGPSIYFARSGP